eukprot:755579-Hanusia_phi.AAC.3
MRYGRESRAGHQPHGLERAVNQEEGRKLAEARGALWSTSPSDCQPCDESRASQLRTRTAVGQRSPVYTETCSQACSRSGLMTRRPTSLQTPFQKLDTPRVLLRAGQTQRNCPMPESLPKGICRRVLKVSRGNAASWNGTCRMAPFKRGFFHPDEA